MVHKFDHLDRKQLIKRLTDDLINVKYWGVFVTHIHNSIYNIFLYLDWWNKYLVVGCSGHLGKYEYTRSLGGPGPGPNFQPAALRASLTSSFAPFGRSGRVTHADVSMMHVSMMHVSMMHVSMIHVSMMYVPMIHVSMVHVSMMHVYMMHASIMWCMYPWWMYPWCMYTWCMLVGMVHVE